jgi:hypothetical protein
MAGNLKPTAVVLTLKKAARILRLAGGVMLRLRRVKKRDGHAAIEVSGVEIEGFGKHKEINRE